MDAQREILKARGFRTATKIRSHRTDTGRCFRVSCGSRSSEGSAFLFPTCCSYPRVRSRRDDGRETTASAVGNQAGAPGLLARMSAQQTTEPAPPWTALSWPWALPCSDGVHRSRNHPYYPKGRCRLLPYRSSPAQCTQSARRTCWPHLKQRDLHAAAQWLWTAYPDRRSEE